MGTSKKKSGALVILMKGYPKSASSCFSLCFLSILNRPSASLPRWAVLPSDRSSRAKWPWTDTSKPHKSIESFPSFNFNYARHFATVGESRLMELPYPLKPDTGNGKRPCSGPCVNFHIQQGVSLFEASGWCRESSRGQTPGFEAGAALEIFTNCISLLSGFLYFAI